MDVVTKQRFLFRVSTFSGWHAAFKATNLNGDSTTAGFAVHPF
jgi:hypothetical protein